MKSIFKKQWTQITAVIAAAACAVSATVAGVSGSLSAPINAYAMEAGTEISMTLTKNSEPNETTGEYGYHYVLDLSQTTQEDIGKTVYISCVAPKQANQGLTGAFGYADPTDGYKWKQAEWEANADSEGKYTVSFEIVEGMVGNSGIQFQCWYPSTDDIKSCVAVFDQEPGSEVTTTTTSETTTTTAVTTATDVSSVTTTTAVSGDSTTSEETTTTTTTTAETTTTTTTTVPTGESKNAPFTTGAQTGEADDIQAVAEFKPDGADYAVIVYKVKSEGDTLSSAGIGTWSAVLGKWLQEDYKDVPITEDGTVTLTYNIPENVGDIVKAMVFSPSYENIEFQSITLYYGSTPSSTTTTTGSELTYTTVNVNDNNITNVVNKCYLLATMKADPNTTLSGAVYYDNETLSFSGTTDANGILTAGFKIRKGLNECNFKIQESSGPKSVQVNLTSYWWGDASLNGKVNGSDVRAIANYIKSNGKENSDKNNDMNGYIKNVVCDYDDDGSVSLADAVSLTKALIGSGKVPGAN